MRTPRLGPGLLVAAAFIGPGTVTTASVAGAGYGTALLWTVAFAVLATIALQEMSARVGLASGHGLGEAVRRSFASPFAKALAAGLVVGAIGLGNAAFQMGNLTGAAIGLEALWGLPRQLWVVVVAVTAFALLGTGVYRWIERSLVAMVAVMGIVFPLTAWVAGPDPGQIARGLFVPRLPEGSLLTVIALIGTTVVPYNLFLHASAAREKWAGAGSVDEALSESRLDTGISIALGGAITMSVVVTAASFFEPGTRIESAGAMARQLEPLLGPAAHAFFATGLLAAGLTSAITAPLAAAFATAGALGWPADLKDKRFRAVWISIMLLGTGLALIGQRPVSAILFAQAANGLMLPVIAILLLVVSNRSDLIGRHRNGVAANLIGGSVVFAVSALGIAQLLRLAGVLG